MGRFSDVFFIDLTPNAKFKGQAQSIVSDIYRLFLFFARVGPAGPLYGRVWPGESFTKSDGYRTKTKTWACPFILHIIIAPG